MINDFSQLPDEVREVAFAAHEQLEAAREQCLGWSRLRYLAHAIMYQADFSADTPTEHVCNNPFRATDEYWDLRAATKQAVARTGYQPTEQVPSSDNNIVEAMIDMTKYRTAKRIEIQQHRLAKRGM